LLNKNCFNFSITWSRNLRLLPYITRLAPLREGNRCREERPNPRATPQRQEACAWHPEHQLCCPKYCPIDVITEGRTRCDSATGQRWPENVFGANQRRVQERRYG